MLRSASSSQRPSTSHAMSRSGPVTERPKTPTTTFKRPVRPTSVLTKNPARVAHAEARRMATTGPNDLFSTRGRIPSAGGVEDVDSSHNHPNDSGESSLSEALPNVPTQNQLTNLLHLKSEEGPTRQTTSKGVVRAVSIGATPNRSRTGAGIARANSRRVSIAPASAREAFSETVLADIVKVHGIAARGITVFPGSEIEDAPIEPEEEQAKTGRHVSLVGPSAPRSTAQGGDGGGSSGRGKSGEWESPNTVSRPPS